MRTTSLITVAIFALTTTAFPTSSPPSRPTTPIPDEKCTFALHQRQQSSITYIQLNTIQDHANNITIDIASQRPPGTFNSYIRLDEKTVFAVTGLLDDERLTITLTGKDDLAFGIGREKWGSWDAHAVRERGSAWCEAKRWEGGVERRVSWQRQCEEAGLCAG